MTIMRRRGMAGTGLAGLLTLMLAGCVEPPPPAVQPDALFALNNQVRANYMASRSVIQQRHRPAIVVEFDDIVLLRSEGPPLRVNFTPQLYHRYKQVAHLPLGVWATLAPWSDRTDGSAWKAPLQALVQRGEAAREALPQIGFPPAQLQRQQLIIDGSLGFMRQVLVAGKVGSAELRAWARQQTPLLLANADDAAALQIDGLHAVVTQWRQDSLTPEQWQRLHVFVLGPKMPRADNLAMQYFERLMGRAARDRRLVYAEGIFNVAAADGLLGTLTTDRQLAVDFFADEARMDRDFLADGARRRLDAIFPRPQP